MTNEIVFVLGAGFTRAFVPEAPLMVDDYGISSLRERFSTFCYASAVLDAAVAERSDGRIDLERLMSRLSGMPYDAGDARRELELLERELRITLVKKLRDAEAAGVDWEKLKMFARQLVTSKSASIVTFNYDDILDQALWEVRENPANIVESQRMETDWHPDGGYGFYCRPSSVCVIDTPAYMDRPNTLLLKLHGSLNWRSRLGEGMPRGPAGILHHEKWFPLHLHAAPLADSIELHLEPDPFIVPPVLVKSELTTHPVLRVVWEFARDRLSKATTVVFIGYSLPMTDLASRILFSETLLRNPAPEVTVVNLAEDEAIAEGIKKTYSSLFKNLSDANFHLSGAWEWIQRQIT
jgi:SIR2-like domain